MENANVNKHYYFKRLNRCPQHPSDGICRWIMVPHPPNTHRERYTANFHRTPRNFISQQQSIHCIPYKTLFTEIYGVCCWDHPSKGEAVSSPWDKGRRPRGNSLPPSHKNEECAHDRNRKRWVAEIGKYSPHSRQLTWDRCHL